MELISAQYSHRGRLVKTPWSPQVRILEVLFSVRVSCRVFHGVRAETEDMNWDWPDVENLLWVFDGGNGLQLSQVFQHHPHVVDRMINGKIEAIVGDYQSSSGNVYFGVKWEGYDCPTWELEEEILIHDRMYLIPTSESTCI